MSLSKKNFALGCWEVEVVFRLCCVREVDVERTKSFEYFVRCQDTV